MTAASPTRVLAMAGLAAGLGALFLVSSSAGPAQAASGPPARPTLTGPSKGVTYQSLLYTAKFRVKGSATAVVLQVDWGDGNTVEYSYKADCSAARCPARLAAFSHAHPYVAAGTYPITFAVMNRAAVIGAAQLRTSVTVTDPTATVETPVPASPEALPTLPLPGTFAP